MEKLKISALAALLLTGAQAFAWHYPEPGNQELPFDKGEGTQELPYQITNAQQLAVLAYLVNNGTSYEGQYFVLENDIDLNEGFTFTAEGPDKDGAMEWIPIGTGDRVAPFMGHFNGQGHTISGLYMTDGKRTQTPGYVGYDHAGLFGATYGSVIENLNIVNSCINMLFPADTESSWMVYVGSVAGQMEEGNINNCSADVAITVNDEKKPYVSNKYEVGGIVGNIYADDHNIHNMDCNGTITVLADREYDPQGPFVGGIMGRHGWGSISDCTNNASVTTSGRAAGISAGEIMGIKLENLTNNGIITSTQERAAGIVCNGGSETVRNCINNGDIYFATDAAGILLDGDAETLEDCHNHGNLINNGNGSTSPYAGGLVYYGDFIKNVVNCSNAGNIDLSASNSEIGGAAGIICNGGITSESLFDRCSNTGNVVGISSAAGITLGFDMWSDNRVFRNCYNAGEIKSAESAVGLVTSLNGSAKFQYCHNYGRLSGLSDETASIMWKAESVELDHVYALESDYSPIIYKGEESTGEVEVKTKEEFNNGTVCNLLNEGQQPLVWGQDVSCQPYPVLDGKGLSAIESIFADSAQDALCRIYDLSGSEVLVVEKSSVVPSLQRLSKGIYVVKCGNHSVKVAN